MDREEDTRVQSAGEGDQGLEEQNVGRAETTAGGKKTYGS